MILTEECGRRNSLKLLILAQPLCESVVSSRITLAGKINLVCQLTPICHHEISSLRNHRFHTNICQNSSKIVSLSLKIHRNGSKVTILLIKSINLLLKPPCHRLLDRSWTGVDTVLMDNPTIVDQSRGTNCPTKLPSCHGESLSRRSNTYGSIPHTRHGSNPDHFVVIKDHMFIDLITDHQEIIVNTNVADIRYLVPADPILIVLSH